MLIRLYFLPVGFYTCFVYPLLWTPHHSGRTGCIIRSSLWVLQKHDHFYSWNFIFPIWTSSFIIHVILLARRQSITYPQVLTKRVFLIDSESPLPLQLLLEPRAIDWRVGKPSGNNFSDFFLDGLKWTTVWRIWFKERVAHFLRRIFVPFVVFD